MQSKRLYCCLIGMAFFAFSSGMLFSEERLSTAGIKEMSVETSGGGQKDSGNGPDTMTLFLCGDVMLGRGIDQVLPYPGDPILHEPYMTSARGYVTLAEQVTGTFPYPANFTYIWGDALEELKQVAPDLRIINLETSITQSNDYWPDKGINYKMNPENIGCLTAAEIDCCSLANNHVLDWGYSGLTETLETLKAAHIKSAGAGENLREAEAPAIMNVKEKGRCILFSYGMESSGIPYSWAASKKRPGVNFLENLSARSLEQIQEKVKKIKQPKDIVVLSIHWGGNWGFRIPPAQREFAHQLIDTAGIDVIYGHSSHHIKGIEIYKDKPILYGCGDFLNDYEGIGGHEDFRGELALMYFVSMEPSTGKLLRLRMIPTRTRHFKVNRASADDALWLRDTLNREGEKLGTRVTLDKDNTLRVSLRSHDMQP